MNNLPTCNYPKTTDVTQHGLLSLPRHLTPLNWSSIEKYRSKQFVPKSVKHLPNTQVLEMAKIVARSFAKNEPMLRHLHLPREMPEDVKNYIHTDAFGSTQFGEWSFSNLMYWFIRLFILTDPTCPKDKISIQEDLSKFSIATIDSGGKIIGGAFNTIVHPEEQANRELDPLINIVFTVNKPVLELIFGQEYEAIEALKEQYPDFKTALENQKIGTHFLIARSPKLPKEDTFELVAASAETFKNQGFEFMVVCATNQWTGAACEVLNGTRVHYAPYRVAQNLPKPEIALPSETFSDDGYLSDKDSGAMFYVIKLK